MRLPTYMQAILAKRGLKSPHSSKSALSHGLREGAVPGAASDHRRLDASLLLVPPRQLHRKGLLATRLDEADGAAPEAAAHQPGPKEALDAVRQALHDVQLRAGVPEVVAAGAVRGRHELAQELRVALLQGVDACLHTLVLEHNVMGDAALRRGQPRAVFGKGRSSHVSQVRDRLIPGCLAQSRGRREAARPQLVVLAIHELVRRVRVGKDEHGTSKRHVVVAQRAAIKEQQGTAASHARAELVKDATAHAHKVVLSCLCRLDQRQVVQLTDGLGEEPGEELGGGHLHGRGAGDAGARWHV
mmetsp:Transcript_122563/g.357910  ORF Transcript_122563/g.357910 Transcript_122563/m.357910 type:complete len:301 (+) Transcript_122563:147-1049(+)